MLSVASLFSSILHSFLLSHKEILLLLQNLWQTIYNSLSTSKTSVYPSHSLVLANLLLIALSSSSFSFHYHGILGLWHFILILFSFYLIFNLIFLFFLFLRQWRSICLGLSLLLLTPSCMVASNRELVNTLPFFESSLLSNLPIYSDMNMNIEINTLRDWSNVPSTNSIRELLAHSSVLFISYIEKIKILNNYSFGAKCQDCWQWTSFLFFLFTLFLFLFLFLFYFLFLE